MYVLMFNMKYLVEKKTFEMARSNTKSVLNVAANPKEQKVLIESPKKNDIDNAKRKADSDIVNPKEAKFSLIEKRCKEKPHKCPLCFSSFRVEDSLISHVRDDHKRKHVYQCSVCDKPCPNKDILERHIIAIHRLSQSNPCLVCHAGFIVRSDLVKHVFENHTLINEDNQELQCPICYQDFRASPGQRSKPGIGKIQLLIGAKNMLKHHIVRCLEKNKLFKCEMCKGELNFENEVEWKVHMNKIHNVQNKESLPIATYEKDQGYCDICRIMVIAWKGHMKRVHQIEYEVVEPKVTSQGSQNSATKQNDSKTVSPKNVFPGYHDLKCTICGKILSDEASLRFHIREEHINDSAYINSMLEETKIAKRNADSFIVNPKMAKFANFGIKSLHIKSGIKSQNYISQRQKPKKQMCQIRFENPKPKLPTKRYPCALCYSCFDSIQELSSHMMTEHKRIYLYQCSICDKPLKTKTSLEYHIMVSHNGESNPCFICHAGFIMKSDLARHVYDDHNNIPPNSGSYQCPLCFIPILGAGSISRNGIKYVQAQARSKLRIHLLDCIEKKSDVCFMCKVRFENEAELKNHMNSHETEDVCKKCLNDDKEHCKECGCMKCGGKTPVERLLFCEKCQFYIHFECLPHPIESLEELPGGSDTDFFCPSCSDENLKEILDSQMLDGLKNETRSPKLEEMEMDKIQSNFNEFDPLALETQDISLKPELDIGSNIVQNTVIMEPKQAAYEKDQDYWSGIEWKGHMKPVHQIEYQVFEQNPDYYPSDIKDCNVEVVAPTNLNEDIKPVEVFEPAYSKEFNQNFDYPIDFLAENSNNTEVDGVVVKQISEDFAEEHKFTSFSQLETDKIEDLQYYCSFCSLNWKNVDEFLKHKCVDGTVQT